jgi:hypothetical protein
MDNPQPWWRTWPVAEVAAAILPVFSDRPALKEEAAVGRILSWCQTGSRGPNWKSLGISLGIGNDDWFENPDVCAIAEALQVLERAGLLRRALRTRKTVGQLPGYVMEAYFYVGVTRLGWHALQTNTVREHLGLSGTPPTT